MRVYNLLLRLYPASFRNEYGEEMRALFARRRRDGTGRSARSALWLQTIGEVIGNAALVHVRPAAAGPALHRPHAAPRRPASPSRRC